MAETTDDRLRLLIERIERLAEEKQGIADDIKDAIPQHAGARTMTSLPASFIRHRVFRVVRDYTPVGWRGAITGETRFDDLCIDSLERVSLLVELEDRLGCSIEDDFDFAVTVGAFADLVERAVAGARKVAA